MRREREATSFVRLSVEDGEDGCEVDIAIDYHALEPVRTPYGSALDLRELGANKVLAIFGLDLDVLAHALGRFERIEPRRLGLDDRSYQDLRAAVQRLARRGPLRARERAVEEDTRHLGQGPDRGR